MGGQVTSPAFVGRARELAALGEALEQARGGASAVLLVGGEAGVGKTRLVNELAARRTGTGTRVLVGGCVPLADGGLPFAPAVEALRDLVAQLGVRPVRTLAGPSWPELARLLPALGDPDHAAAGAGSHPPPEATDQLRLFELVLGLLAALAEQAELVLVVEDVHWADRSTRDLLAYLARNLRHQRVVVLVTHRSDEPGSPWLGPFLAELGRAGARRVEVTRFGRAESVAQMTTILGGEPPADVVDRVFARAEGNPFFTEELLAAVYAGSRELPATSSDLLRGRIQAVSEPARQALRVAAVIGRRARHRLLAAVAGADGDRLEKALREAVAEKLLVTRPGDDSYEFRHALLREVAYADLLPGERARLHGEVAAALAAHPGWVGGTRATVAAELAHHWDAAGDLERALPAAVEAGHQAERAYAFAEAQRHFERALELWPEVPRAAELTGLARAGLLERAAGAAHLAGDDARAVQLLRQALAGVDPASDPARAGSLQELLGRSLWETLDDGALAAYQEAVRLVPAEPPSAERARVLAGYAELLLVLVGSGAEARQAAEEALATARRAGARREEGRALANLGTMVSEEDVEEGLAMLKEARRIAAEQDDVDGFGWASLQLVENSEAAGRLEEALAVALESAEVSRRLGSSWQLSGTFFAAYLEFLLGRWEDADRHFGTALGGDQRTGPLGIHVRIGWARLAIARGAGAGARRALQQAETMAAGGGQAQFDAQWAHRLAGARAELALWEGRDHEAAAAVAEGLAALARSSEETYFPTLFMLGLAAAAGQAERALDRRDAAGAEAARRHGDELLARLEAGGGPPERRRETAAVLLHCRAEQARLHGRPDPAAWAAAAAGWEALGQPYPAACARWREAEALLAGRAPRAEVEQSLWAAHAVAARLGAAPLRRELEKLARRGRVRLEPPAEPAPAADAEAPSVARSLGLTRREAEVLTLVAAGRSNRQVAKALFISEKTASIHVSHILAKLGVAGRVEAAAVAHRMGLAE
jgi:DNA-binding CsgD family transcriptional regulator/tetratricopeptide (TPR) repeat protein